ESTRRAPVRAPHARVRRRARRRRADRAGDLRRARGEPRAHEGPRRHRGHRYVHPRDRGSALMARVVLLSSEWLGSEGARVVQETSEDVYSGFEHTVTEGVFEAVKVTTRAASERIARFAYDLARSQGRKKLSIVHKANIMKRADGLFLDTARAVGKSYADITT